MSYLTLTCFVEDSRDLVGTAWEDMCGNITVNIQKLTLIDTVGPEIVFTNPILDGVSNGGSVTIECDTNLDVTCADATANDNCDDNPSLDCTMEVEIGDCMQDGFFERRDFTWFAQDECGNTTTFSVTVFFVDTTPPEVTAPADVTVDCNSIPPVTDPIVSDNCDTNLDVDFEASQEIHNQVRNMAALCRQASGKNLLSKVQ